VAERPAAVIVSSMPVTSCLIVDVQVGLELTSGSAAARMVTRGRSGRWLGLIPIGGSARSANLGGDHHDRRSAKQIRLG
jgi:hypothetical protein